MMRIIFAQGWYIGMSLWSGFSAVRSVRRLYGRLRWASLSVQPSLSFRTRLFPHVIKLNSNTVCLQSPIPSAYTSSTSSSPSSLPSLTLPPTTRNSKRAAHHFPTSKTTSFAPLSAVYQSLNSGTQPRGPFLSGSSALGSARLISLSSGRFWLFIGSCCLPSP